VEVTHERNLIVGASGQIGAEIASVLTPERRLCAVRGKRAGFLHVDLSTLDLPGASRLVEQTRADAVYCVGGMTNVELCEAEPDMAIRTNCTGPAALAFAAAEHGASFAYFSTEYIFDGDAGPYTEAAKPNPISVYGRSKWMGEVAVTQAHPGALILRTTVVYGPDPGGKNFLYSLRRAWLSKAPIRVPADQISTPTYNRDIALAAVGLMKQGATGVFHACGPELLSRVEFAAAAASHMGWHNVRIVPTPTCDLGQVAHRPLRAGLCTNKLSQLYPEIRMRPLADCCADWLGQQAFAEQV
jgi:dTDP-4-dehydrorhamnose reductase